MFSLLKTMVTLPLSIKDITMLGIKMISIKAMHQMAASLLLEIKVTQLISTVESRKPGKSIKDIILGIKIISTKAMYQMVASLLLEIKVTQLLSTV